MENASIEYKSNSIYKVRTVLKEVMSGTWSINKRSDKILQTTTWGNSNNGKIIVLNETNLEIVFNLVPLSVYGLSV